jgi:pyridoxal 5'-phosphate synthase pdxT subunit
MVTIGILALQGDFAEHKSMVEQCGAVGVLIKHAHELAAVDGLIIPGGESTTIAKLTGHAADGIFEAILERAKGGMPIYGTCMGTIFLARNIEGSAQGRLALMNITVKRNAFGSQKFSREEPLHIACLGAEPFNVVFIRGPIITACGDGVEPLASVSEGTVMARQDNLLVTAFHPELTGDIRLHKYFMKMVQEWRQSTHPAATITLLPATSQGYAKVN